MLKISQNRSRIAMFLLGLSITTTAPIIIPPPIIAQPLYQFSNPKIVQGRIIPINYEKEKIIVTPDETTPVTLIVAQDMKTKDGFIVIPKDSKINGQIQPVPNTKGSQFIAKEVIFPNGKKLSINAVSGVITRTETITKGANTGSILTGAAIGGAAATAISVITGSKNINLLTVLGGAAAGALGGVLLGKQKVDVLVIYPQQDLALTVQSDIILDPRF
jgi:hypothetical protein